jgi:hypothetical protein
MADSRRKASSLSTTATESVAVGAANIQTWRPDAPRSSSRQDPRAFARTVTRHSPTR